MERIDSIVWAGSNHGNKSNTAARPYATAVHTRQPVYTAVYVSRFEAHMVGLNYT